MSYAYPDVRNNMISQLRETAVLGADGVAIIYVRNVPIVLYEQPIVGGFKAQYGEGPEATRREQTNDSCAIVPTS